MIKFRAKLQKLDKIGFGQFTSQLKGKTRLPNFSEPAPFALLKRKSDTCPGLPGPPFVNPWL